jgi:Domain of unknown function (DUF4350)
MQTGLTPGDRKILAVAGGLFVALTLATIVAAPASETAWSPVPSSYLSTPGGARAAFLLLQRLGVKSQRWEEPPLRLVAFAHQATLVLAEPTETPSRAERSALRRFAEQGGRVLFCGAELPSFFPGVELQKLLSGPELLEEAESAQLPVERYRPVLEKKTSEPIELQPHAVWQKFGKGQAAVYGRPDNAVVAVWALGAGEVIWWASATPLTNAGLGRAGNLPLFLNSVRADFGRQVYWDEYFHGERGSLLAYAGRVPVIRWAAFQFALFTCACLLAFSRRSGPVIPSAKLSRLSPLEFVETLGGLYHKAKAAQVAVDISMRHLRLQLARRLGLPVAIADADLARAAAERLGWDEQELETLLSRAHAKVARSLPPSSALHLVQGLQGFSARLTSPAPASERQ